MSTGEQEPEFIAKSIPEHDGDDHGRVIARRKAGYNWHRDQHGAEQKFPTTGQDSLTPDDLLRLQHNHQTDYPPHDLGGVIAQQARKAPEPVRAGLTKPRRKRS